MNFILCVPWIADHAGLHLHARIRGGRQDAALSLPDAALPAGRKSEGSAALFVRSILREIQGSRFFGSKRLSYQRGYLSHPKRIQNRTCLCIVWRARRQREKGYSAGPVESEAGTALSAEDTVRVQGSFCGAAVYCAISTQAVRGNKIIAIFETLYSTCILIRSSCQSKWWHVLVGLFDIAHLPCVYEAP